MEIAVSGMRVRNCEWSMSLFKCYERDEGLLDGHCKRYIFILNVYVYVHLSKFLERNFPLKAKKKKINSNVKGKYFFRQE